jgi:DHA2 family multidrug resistance protein
LLAKAQAILFETFPIEEQPMAQGLFGAIVIAGPAIGPTLGGYLTTNFSWRWIFFVNVPVGIVAVIASMAFLPPDTERKRNGSIDWLAIGLLAIGLGSLQGVLEEGQQELWFESSLIRALSAVAVVGLGGFVVRALRSKAPVVDLRVLRYRSLWAGSMLSAVIGMVLYGSLFALPIFADVVMHYTSQQVGMLLLPAAVASAFAMPIAAKLLQRMDPRILLLLGGGALLVSMKLFSTLSTDTGGGDLLLPNLVRGVGVVMMFLPLQLAALGPIPKAEVAAASGFFNLTRQLGGSIGVALLTTMLDKRTTFHRAMLAENLTAGDSRTIERLGALSRVLVERGQDVEAARRAALALLDRTLNLQAAVLSFSDTFLATGALLLVSLPLVFLLGKPTAGAKVSMGH